MGWVVSFTRQPLYPRTKRARNHRTGGSMHATQSVWILLRKKSVSYPYWESKRDSSDGVDSVKETKFLSISKNQTQIFGRLSDRLVISWPKNQAWCPQLTKVHAERQTGWYFKVQFISLLYRIVILSDNCRLSRPDSTSSMVSRLSWLRSCDQTADGMWLQTVVRQNNNCHNLYISPHIIK